MGERDFPQGKISSQDRLIFRSEAFFWERSLFNEKDISVNCRRALPLLPGVRGRQCQIKFSKRKMSHGAVGMHGTGRTFIHLQSLLEMAYIQKHANKIPQMAMQQIFCAENLLHFFRCRGWGVGVGSAQEVLQGGRGDNPDTSATPLPMRCTFWKYFSEKYIILHRRSTCHQPFLT